MLAIMLLQNLQIKESKIIQIIFFTYLSLYAYSHSIVALSRIKCPYFSRKSIPFCVCRAKLSYWSCKTKKALSSAFRVKCKNLHLDHF